MAQLLQELAADPNHFVDGLHHVDRDADGASLVGDGPGDGLPDPPGSVGGELVALGVVELLHRLDQAQIALLDQIQEQHAPAHVPLGDGHHQAEVGLRQLLLGGLTLGVGGLPGGDLLLGVRDLLPLLPEPVNLRQLPVGLVARAHGLGQVDLLIRGQQGHLADLLEVHTHRIVDGEAVHQSVGIHQLLFLHIGDLLCGGLVIRQVRQQGIVGADVDVQRLQGVVELIHLIALQIQVIHRVHQICGVQLALLLTAGQQFPQFFVVHQPGGCGQRSHLLVVQPEDAGLPGLLVRHDGGGLLGRLLPLFPGGLFGRPCSRLPLRGLLRRICGRQERVCLSLQLLGAQLKLICHAAFLQYPFCLCIFLWPPAAGRQSRPPAASRPPSVRCGCSPPAPVVRFAETPAAGRRR